MTHAIRTQVAIIGAGPAGLLLSHLLHLEGIESVLLEAKGRDYIEGRIRAGVLEQGSVELLKETGLGARLEREGLRHEGIALRFDGCSHRIDFAELTGGKAVTVYGQHEVIKDMVAARVATGNGPIFAVEDVTLHDLTGTAPMVRYRKDGTDHEIRADFIAGCDGFHGTSRPSIPASAIRFYEKVYPFGWLGILAKSKPVSEELIYASHDNGFALFSMRSHELTRAYIQCAPDEDVARWSDDDIWNELETRLDPRADLELQRGEVLQRAATGMRSFVAEPMQYGRLYLAGDAAHIVPPTGAKGMNLAMNDVRILSHGLVAHYKGRDDDTLQEYSCKCLRRIWKVERFSWWMTSLLHRFHDHSPFERKLQSAELDWVTNSRVAATALAENYVGLPWDQ